MVLDIDKISFSEASLVDDIGRVFFYSGRVFRAIFKSKRESCIEFLESNLYKELREEKLVPKTWVSEYRLDGFSMVLEHEFVQESKPHHWSFTMYKDVALLLLKINEICNKHGYELKDAHPYNVFFNQNNPVLIDFGSIIKIESPIQWSAFEEFVSYCYVQLLVWSKPDFFLARKLIEDGNYPLLRTNPMSKILDSDFLNTIADDVFDFKMYYKNKPFYKTSQERNPALFLTKAINKAGSTFLRRPVKAFSYVKVLKEQEYVKEKIKSLNRPVTKSLWENYHCTYQLDKEVNSTPRFDRIIQLIQTYAPDVKTAVDLAGNQGVFSQLLLKALNLERVVLTDYDEKAIDTAYKIFKRNKVNVQPYVLNFMFPVKSEDVSLLQSDVAFALAVTHHLVLTQKYILSAVFNKISQYSKKYVVIEFMPIGLYNGKGETPETPEFYTLTWFRDEFNKKFTLLVEEELEANRIVFIGKKNL